MSSKCEQFLDFFDYLVNNCKEPVVMSNEVKEFYFMLKQEGMHQSERPLFTDTGIQILEYLQLNNSKNKSKDIADGMNISSRKVSGAIRKLVNDGFVDKFGSNPVIYSLTEKGRNFDIKDYKEKMNNES